MKKTVLYIALIFISSTLCAFLGFQYGQSYNTINVEGLNVNNDYQQYVPINNIIFSADEKHRSRMVLVEIAIEVNSSQARNKLNELKPLIKSLTVEYFVKQEKNTDKSSLTLINKFKKILNEQLQPELESLMGNGTVGSILITKLIVN